MTTNAPYRSLALQTVIGGIIMYFVMFVMIDRLSSSGHAVGLARHRSARRRTEHFNGIAFGNGKPTVFARH